MYPSRFLINVFKHCGSNIPRLLSSNYLNIDLVDKKKQITIQVVDEMPNSRYLLSSKNSNYNRCCRLKTRLNSSILAGRTCVASNVPCPCRQKQHQSCRTKCPVKGSYCSATFTRVVTLAFTLVFTQGSLVNVLGLKRIRISSEVKKSAEKR